MKYGQIKHRNILKLIMFNLTQALIDEITKNCINSYQNLPKSGKPLQEEWTVLSCIVKYDTITKEHQVVSLGTGSKCIGASKMSPAGNLLNDSHAEVFARRGFLIYLYDNIISFTNNKQSIFNRNGETFELKDNIKFIFYSSQMPCGDASIIPKEEDVHDHGDLIVRKREAASNIDLEIDVKRAKLDIHRTGAKCLTHSEQDSKEAGQNYHIVGQVRTKPGRGDRTLSVSCSDKMARWIHVGIQGSLLDMLLSEPIFISHFIFGGQMPYSEETLHRALLNRDCSVSLDNRLKEVPKFYQSSLKFIHTRGADNVRPAAGSIVCVDSSERILEVAVQGKKLGVTNKKSKAFHTGLCISKYNLYKKFQEILLDNKDLHERICSAENLSAVQYNKMKLKSIRYQTNWSKTKQVFFKTWTTKPDMWDFTIDQSK